MTAKPHPTDSIQPTTPAPVFGAGVFRWSAWRNAASPAAAWKAARSGRYDGPRMKYGFLIGSALVLIGVAAHAQDAPTYAKDIAPILFQNCVRCHRTGQIAPMSLMTYDEVRPWAKSIQREVAARNMPPFDAAGPLGRYLDDPRLSDEAVDAIVRWVDDGAPQGDPAGMPEPPVFNDEGWTLGEPDLIVTFPAIEIPMDDSEDHAWYYGDTVFEENFWFGAAQLKTKTPRQLHHANVFVTGPDEPIPNGGGPVPKERQTLKDRLRAMMAYLPGQESIRFPDTSPGRLTKGWGLVMDCHYVPGETATTDEIQIGFYKAEDGQVEAFNKEVGVLAGDILIPPRAPDYVRKYTKAFPEAAFVTGFHVHMHYRGKSTTIRLRYPGKPPETILEIPAWDQNWQREYMLAEPIAVPHGTIAEFEAHWDNSPENPKNPDPTVWVREGMASKNEMYNGSIYYRPQQLLETPIKITNGREIDTE